MARLPSPWADPHKQPKRCKIREVIVKRQWFVIALNYCCCRSRFLRPRARPRASAGAGCRPSLIYGRVLWYFSSRRCIWAELTVHFIFLVAFIYPWFSGDIVQSSAAVYVTRHRGQTLADNEITNRTAKKLGNNKKKTKKTGKQFVPLCFPPCLSYSVRLSVFPSLRPFLPLSLSSSNNAKIKLHYTLLYWSFGTFRTGFSAGQRRNWLMTHDALIESFLSGQIILTMWPLNSIIAQNGILNSSECCGCL